MDFFAMFSRLSLKKIMNILGQNLYDIKIAPNKNFYHKIKHAQLIWKMMTHLHMPLMDIISVFLCYPIY